MKRSWAILTLLALAGLLWVLSTQTWVEQTQAENIVQGVHIAVGEAESATNPVLQALAAVMAVIALLFAMVGLIGRWIVGAIYILCASGYVAVAASYAFSSNPTPVAYGGLAAGLLAVGAAAWVLRSSIGWKASAKYSTTSTAEPDVDDPTHTWDALSRGEDPS